jgi:hypothetical protein
VRVDSAWVRYTYAPEQTDWVAVYDLTTDCCYYLHSTTWAGMARPRLRLTPAANGQHKGIRWAHEFLYPELDGERPQRTAERSAALGMLVHPTPG